MAPNRDLAKTVGMWKRWFSKTHKVAWQPNFFEHRLRRNESAAQKGQYIYDNPARAGLIARAEDWPWTWRPDVE
jgi:putative transposase